jgi:hypothetical protein
MFVSKAGPTKVKDLSGAPLCGRLPALPANIIIRWKDLPGTNTLAYYEYSYNTAVKSYLTLSTVKYVFKKHRHILKEE